MTMGFFDGFFDFFFGMNPKPEGEDKAAVGDDDAGNGGVYVSVRKARYESEGEEDEDDAKPATVAKATSATFGSTKRKARSKAKESYKRAKSIPCLFDLEKEPRFVPKLIGGKPSATREANPFFASVDALPLQVKEKMRRTQYIIMLNNMHQRGAVSDDEYKTAYMSIQHHIQGP